MSFVDHVDHAVQSASKVVDDGEAPDSNESQTERCTRVHWFGCGVRLPSPQGLASGGNSRGGEDSTAA